MLNTSELESRWLKYKIRSYIPYGVIGISSIIIVTILIYLFNNNTARKVEKKSDKVEKIVTITTPLKQINKPLEKKLEIEEKIEIGEKYASNKISEVPKPKQTIQYKQVKLTPSLGFMKDMQSSSLPYDNNEKIVPNKKTPQRVIEKPISKPKPKVEPLQEKKNTAIDEEQRSKITIKRRDTMQDIKSIITRFKKKNNPGLSLFIAKKYYELGDYEKAYNYALITNKLNSDIEDSWLVFSKSLFKLGKKDEAMNTLKQYIKSSYSSNAKLLLEEMNSGKFR